MAPQRRSSGPPPEGPDPRDPWREYADDPGLSDDSEWADDIDPYDDRPLPRRRRRGRRVARALAWIGGAALLMVAGGFVALATWPRLSGPAPTVALTTGEAPAPAGTAPSEIGAARAPEDGEAWRTPEVVGRADESETPDPAVTPPPLPPLPPGFEPATPPAASPREAAAPAPAPAPVAPEASSPRPVGSAAAPVAPSPPRDTRTSEEIMADFLVSSGDRAQAEAAARAYAEWYAAGSAERAYWHRVLAAIRGRP